MKKLRILISRPDRIGDVVLSTPIPREIKRQFPDSFVSVMLRPYTNDIYINNPFVDEIIIYDDKVKDFSFLKMLKKIRSFNFSHSIMLLPDEKINYLFFLAGIKNRIGVGHKFYQFITNTKSVFRNKYIPLRHESDYCLDSIRKIGVTVKNPDPEIYLTSNEKVEASETKRGMLKNKKFLVGLHISSGNSAPNWEKELYIDLLRKLENNLLIMPVITDNFIPDEFKALHEVCFLNKDKNLRDSIKNFSMLDLLISASTGPMHIASALKVKTLSLFCPMTACSPELWGPKGNISRIILPEPDYCKTKCPGDPKKCRFADGGITVERVVRELESVLEGTVI